MQQSMRAIFISYRRNDTEGEAGRLFDDLIAEFGENSVFMDVTAIEAGRDFRKAIDESVATCGVLLAIIGKNWVEAKDDNGQRRLDDPTDFVRLETSSALRRDIPVIPVIVRGATMPRPEQLPDELRDLAYRNCAELTHARWGSDVQLLIATLRRQLAAHKTGIEAARTDTAGAGAAAQPTRGAVAVDEKTAATGVVPQFRQTNGHHDKKSWPLWVAIGVCAIAAAVAAYIFIPRQVTMPNLRGETLANATTKLQALHLTVGQTTTRRDPSVDANVVLSQYPPSDEQVRRGTAVDLVVSEAVAQVEVPPLTGQTLDAASKLLAQHQLNIGDIERQSRAGTARDVVLQQFPKPGETVKSGARIDLLVSDTPPSEAVSTSTTKAGKTADADWAAQQAAKRAAAKQAALAAAADKAAADRAAADKAAADKAAADKAAADKAAADRAAADKAAAEQAARPRVSVSSATCTTIKPGQYKVDLSGDAYAPVSDPDLLFVFVAIGDAGTRWRPECTSWSVPQSGEDPLWDVTCMHRPSNPSQTRWQTSRLINIANKQPPTNGGASIFKMGAHSSSSVKFNLTCQ